MRGYLPRVALMLGNFATGISILAPAGMLTVLADGLGVGIRDTGLLVTFGAMILCVGSPLVAWLTTRIDRRLLLVGTLAVLVVGAGGLGASRRTTPSSCATPRRCSRSPRSTRRRRRRPSR